MRFAMNSLSRALGVLVLFGMGGSNLSGCAKLPKLSDQQKDEFLSTASSAVGGSVLTSGGTSGASSSKITHRDVSVSDKPVDANQAAEDLLDCKSMTSSDSKTVVIEGTQCPFIIKMTSETASPTSALPKGKVYFSAKIKETSDLLESAKSSGSTITWTWQQSKSFGGDVYMIELEGELSRHPSGEKLRIHGDGKVLVGSSVGRSKLTFGIDFPDYVAELQIESDHKADGERVTKYYLNDEEVSKDVVKKYFATIDDFAL